MTTQGAGRFSQTLTTNEENILVKCLIAGAEFSYSCDGMELMHLFEEYVGSNDTKNSFKDGINRQRIVPRIYEWASSIFPNESRTSPNC